jgi:hypothetical protein
MKNIPRNLPEFYEIEGLLKTNRWETIYPRMREVTAKYKRAKKYHIVGKLKELYDTFFLKYN